MDDTTAMNEAMRAASTARTCTSPNPYVGAVVVDHDGHDCRRWRGRFAAVRRIGDDIRLDIVPLTRSHLMPAADRTDAVRSTSATGER